MKAIKIRATDKQSIEAIQEYMFNEGYVWTGDDVQEINHVDCGNGGGFYGYANGHMGWDFAEAFSKHPYEEEFLPLHEDFKEVTQTTEDAVNSPRHYTSHPSGIECIDVTRHMSFNLGNATKYIWRCDLKKDAIEDLRKAIFYLNDEINLRLSKKEC